MISYGQLLQAYKLNMTGVGYAWLMIGWYRDGWYLDEEFIQEERKNGLLNCTQEELKQAVEGSYYIATESMNLRPDENTTIISGLV